MPKLPASAAARSLRISACRLVATRVSSVAGRLTMRAVAAGFLITGDLMERTVGQLSEGQKGLLSFARLVLMQPGLLVLDEPTNHINFRHIPVIAQAVNDYEGALILISHMPDFVKQIRIDEIIDLGKT